MSAAILKWLGGSDTGMSSKAIALSALGAMPEGAKTSYPHDGADFGRCKRLLDACPDAHRGLRALASEGGSYWAALAARWDEIAAAYDAELAGRSRGETYHLMQSILCPLEEAHRNVVSLGSGLTMRFGS